MFPEHNPRPGWAQRLREARRERGWDPARLAVELRRAGGRDVSATAESLVRMIRDWERGTYHPRERYRLLLSRVLDVDVDHEAATGSGALVETAGCGGALTRFDTSSDVLAAAAEAQQIAGWVAFDAERQDLSRRMSLEALLTARTAGDRSMEYFVLGQLAMQDAHLHQPVEAMRICEAVLAENTAGSVRTLFTLRRARAAAQMDEHSRARDLIGQTRSYYLDGPRPGDPAWAWWLTEAEIAWHHAMICADLGEWGEAAEHFAAAVDRPTGYDRAVFVSRASLLWALAHARAWGAAETILVRDVLPHQGDVASVRTQRMLTRAARLLDGARGRPSLREAARQLTTNP